ncbi:TPA: hypothetical protein JS394_003638 [Serratia rubidaea]|uniref:hypothetical protein n=1 Tax=Serratia rubidaea TaxID=61652 RepID=UPI000A72351A|nr:hypothetical protein [Serratia rubidaea]HAY0638619.1 hypothetical protein [Serratia rubidaea]
MASITDLLAGNSHIRLNLPSDRLLINKEAFSYQIKNLIFPVKDEIGSLLKTVRNKENLKHVKTQCKSIKKRFLA